jgi:hypothetical protein
VNSLRNLSTLFRATLGYIWQNTSSIANGSICYTCFSVM